MMIIFIVYRLDDRVVASAVQRELSQSGRDVRVQVGLVVGRHVGVRVRQQEVARPRYVLGESDGQTRPAPLLEREARSFHQQPAKHKSVHTVSILF